MHTRKRSLWCMLVVACSLMVAAFAVSTASSATPAKIKLKSGQTALTLTPNAVAAFAQYGASLKPVAPATKVGDTLRLPVRGGTVTTKTLRGTLTHKGGLALAA